MNDAKRLKALAKEFAKNTEELSRRTGLSFDAALELSLNAHFQQNPGTSNQYYHNIRRLVNATQRPHPARRM